jgi:hypothetical protein
MSLTLILVLMVGAWMPLILAMWPRAQLSKMPLRPLMLPLRPLMMPFQPS